MSKKVYLIYERDHDELLTVVDNVESAKGHFKRMEARKGDRRPSFPFYIWEWEIGGTWETARNMSWEWEQEAQVNA